MSGDTFFLVEKIEKRVEELQKYRYINDKKLKDWEILDNKEINQDCFLDIPRGSRKFSIGDSWSGRDRYVWIQRKIYIPDQLNNLFYFDFGRTGAGGNSGFEALMFIDGIPYQGVDSNHREVFLQDGFKGKNITVSLKLWSGLEGGGVPKIQTHIFKEAKLVQLQVFVDNLFYTSEAVLKTISQLDGNNPIKYQLEKVLNDTFKIIDYSTVKSPEFYESVERASKHLNKWLEKIPHDSLIHFTALGHTHIDVAWLWQLKHTREKAARSFSTVLRLMERYPEYVFLQTQPQLYQFVKEDYPALYQQIKKRVEEGRWEVDGAMWLEADCNIPSGESLTRQILHGKKFVREEFGKDMHYLWLPDVFGYSWALPQILKKSGIDTFMTTKISWNQFNRMPHDTFWWKGMDGSKILTHFITTPEIDHDDHSDWYYTYNGHLEPETLLGSYAGYQDKNVNQELLIAYGYGDGGGGTTRDMLEKRRVLDKIPGLPTVKTGTAKQYFEDLHKTFEETDQYVHTWDGELYLEYHRGTYTSQGHVKKTNRKTELALREVEIVQSWLDYSEKKKYPSEKLYKAWEILLRNQFHDIIPGSSIKEVYEDYQVELNGVNNMLAGLKLQESRSSKSISVINTAGWHRDALISLPKCGQILVDQSGEALPQIEHDDKIIALISDMKPLQVKKIYRSNKRQKVIEMQQVGDIKSNGIETDFYQIEWNAEGYLTKIYDKKNNRQVLNGLGNVFQLFEDKPINFDAWDIDIFYQEKCKNLVVDKVDVVENNNLYVVVNFEYRFRDSTIQQLMYLYRHTPRIDFVTDIDWQERQQLLKVKFEVNVRNTEATYDIQYGNVKRPTHWNTSWDMAKFETVAHQWVDLSDRGYGVSLLNDCKYGHDVKENVMRLSLLKGAIYPDPTADLGQHHIVYSLLPHRGDFISGRTVEEAWEINQPLTLSEGELVDNQLLKLKSTESIAIDAIKKAEDSEGYIVRIHDHFGSKRSICFGINMKMEWCETDLMENNISKFYKGDIELEIEPYEIKTIRIKRR